VEAPLERDRDVVKADRLQAREQRPGLDRVVDIVLVEVVQFDAVDAV
jgi:hypothetical protein